ncbi:hypothetical protein ON010_g11109 [Phytophthora cinnamomi]|nr:hypothetical protein ON010_g11109 [Phytophthora cinnamomi]
MASSQKTVLITGSTRGIGLAFVEHYAKAGWNVIATARANSNTDKLKALSPFKVVAMDTADEASIIEAARQLEGVAIDLLINNAGVALPSELTSGTKESIMRQFEVNTVGPFLVTRTLLPNLQLAAKAHGAAFVVQLSSFLGSIGSLTNDTAAFFRQTGYGYSSSKTALNMITRSLSFELRESNIAVVSLHPGYVDTDMTEGKATLKASDSVATMTSLIAGLTPESTGKFFNADPQIPVSELPCLLRPEVAVRLLGRLPRTGGGGGRYSCRGGDASTRFAGDDHHDASRHVRVPATTDGVSTAPDYRWGFQAAMDVLLGDLEAPTAPARSLHAPAERWSFTAPQGGQGVTSAG